MCEHHDEHLAKIAAHLELHTAKIQQLITQLQRTIPVYVDERLYMNGVTTLSLNPQSQNLELINSIIATCSATSGATIVLNDRTITIPMGNTILTNLGLLLRANDTRTMTQATLGTLSLELMGIELMDRGAA